jgi:hypothetical protein
LTANYRALRTKPDRRQRVQTFIRFTEPLPSTTWSFWRLGYQTRFVLLLAWLTLLPTTGPLPQTSQTLAITDTSQKEISPHI